MRGRALRDWLEDLFAGDAVALGLAGFFLLLLLIAGVIWLVDRVKRKNENEKKKKRMKRYAR
jgi:flagellar biogenesis protein FliO